MRKALIMGLGGAVFNFAALWTFQALLEFFLDVRAIEFAVFVGTFFAVFVGMMLIVPAVMVLAVVKLPLRVLFFWELGMAFLWVVSLFAGPVPIWLYLPYWAAFGILVPVSLSLEKPTKARAVSAAPSKKKRDHARGAAISSYGRIPQSTVEMATQWIQSTQHVVREALPSTAPALWRLIAVQAILDHLFNAWATNGVRQSLDEQNQAMVTDFLKLATAVAGSADDPTADAVFRASLNALLDTWRGPCRR